MESFWLALGWVLILEGLGPLLVPNRWQRYLKQMQQLPMEQLRRVGLIMVVAGCLFVLLN